MRAMVNGPAGSHPVHQALYDTARGQSRRRTGANAEENHAETLPQHKPHHLAGAGTERHAYTDFRDAPTGQICQHAIDPDGSQQQGQAGEDAEQK